GVHQYPRRARRCGRGHGNHGRETSSAAVVHWRWNLCHSSAEPRLHRLAREQTLGRRRHFVNLRFCRDRGGADPVRGGEKSIAYAALAFALSVTGTFENLAVLSNVAVLLMYLLCCAACWFLVHRDVRADGLPFNFPGMKIVPALAIVTIIWILAHATAREFIITGIV